MNLDNLPAILTALALVITAIASVVAAWKGQSNGKKLDAVKVQAASTHDLVNGQTAAVIAAATSAAHASGVAQGLATASARPPTANPATDLPPGAVITE